MPDNAPPIVARRHAGRHPRSGYALVAVSVLVIGALALVLLPVPSRPDPNGRAASRGIASADVRPTPPWTSPPVAASASLDEPQPAAESATTTPSSPPGYGCDAALAYLSIHANPEFTFTCPGSADGNEAMTCVNVPGLCEGEHVIVINDPCPAAYMNEAYNSQSWSDAEARFTRPIDPYGAC
jgi:hypothetical protein